MVSSGAHNATSPGGTVPRHPRTPRCHVSTGAHICHVSNGAHRDTSALGAHCHVSGGVHVATSALGPTMPRQHWPTLPRQLWGPHCHVRCGVICHVRCGPVCHVISGAHISYATLHGFFNLNNATLNLNMQQ